MPYTPPLSNAVNFDGTATAYTPPLSNAVNFDDSSTVTLDLTNSGIASTLTLGSPTLTAQVEPVGIGSTIVFGGPYVIPFIVAQGVATGYSIGLPTITEVPVITCIGIDSTLVMGTPGITYTAPSVPATEEEPAAAGGTYAYMHQRTEAYAMRADAKGQNIRISQRITAKPEMVVEQINERDRQDLLDIFTVLRETRKAA